MNAHLLRCAHLDLGNHDFFVCEGPQVFARSPVRPFSRSAVQPVQPVQNGHKRPSGAGLERANGRTAERANTPARTRGGLMCGVRLPCAAPQIRGAASIRAHKKDSPA